MKVLQIEDEPWDSGIAHYALSLSRELSRRGHEVHVLGRRGSPPIEEARAAGLGVLESDQPWLSAPGLVARLRRLGIELINAHTGSGHTLGAALSAALGAPLVRTRGDARPANAHALTRAVARRTAAFVAANSAIEADLLRAFPGRPVRLVPQGIEPEPASPLPEAPVFGVLGRLDAVKGHEDFITAAQDLCKAHPQARFRAAGGDPNDRLPILKRRSSPVEFLGFVADARAFRAGCRVGVVCSTGSEAVSRAALEWLASGRPVVATRVGGLPDLVSEGVTGFLVPPKNPHALAAAMRRFLVEPGLAETMGAAARRSHAERFTLERFADRTLEVYEEVLHRPAP